MLHFAAESYQMFLHTASPLQVGIARGMEDTRRTHLVTAPGSRQSWQVTLLSASTIQACNQGHVSGSFMGLEILFPSFLPIQNPKTVHPLSPTYLHS